MNRGHYLTHCRITPSRATSSFKQKSLKWSLFARQLQHQPSKPPSSSASEKPKPLESGYDGSSLGARILSIPGPSWILTQAQPLAYPFHAYSRAQNAYPYRVQILSSLVIYFLGDLSSQLIQRRSIESPSDEVTSSPAGDIDTLGHAATTETSPSRQESFQYDPYRSSRALVIGGLFSLPSYHWFLFLSRNFNVASHVPHATLLSLAVKVIVNQIVFAPLFNTYFFGMQSLLSNPSTSPVLDTAQNQTSKTNLTIQRDLALRLQAAWRRIKETVPTSWYTSCKFWPLVTAFSFTFVRPQSRSVFAGIVAIGWQSYLGIVNQRAVERGKLSAQTN